MALKNWLTKKNVFMFLEKFWIKRGFSTLSIDHGKSICLSLKKLVKSGPVVRESPRYLSNFVRLGFLVKLFILPSKKKWIEKSGSNFLNMVVNCIIYPQIWSNLVSSFLYAALLSSDIGCFWISVRVFRAYFSL